MGIIERISGFLISLSLYYAFACRNGDWVLCLNYNENTPYYSLKLAFGKCTTSSWKIGTFPISNVIVFSHISGPTQTPNQPLHGIEILDFFIYLVRLMPESYSEPSQTFKPATNFEKSSILDVWLDSEYDSVLQLEWNYTSIAKRFWKFLNKLNHSV